MASAFVTLAAAAAVTERIRLLSAVTLLPVYPMVLAAKMAATLDQVSHGRFELGVGVGGEYPPEFAASGVPVAGRGARTDEALAVLVRLLSRERVTAEGQFGSLRDLRLDPPPVQRPRPPLWVGGRKMPAMRRAGRLPMSRCPGWVGRRNLSCAAWPALGISPGRRGAWREVAGRCPCLCGLARPRSRRAEQEEAVESVSRIYAQDFDPLADRYLLHGDPDMVGGQARGIPRGRSRHGDLLGRLPAGTAPGRDRTVRRGRAPPPGRRINHGVAL